MEITDLSQRQAERRAILDSLTSGGYRLSPFFACATPFAAARDTCGPEADRVRPFVVVGLVWLANQAIGYGILDYPWTLDSAAWGVAIGLLPFWHCWPQLP